MAIQVGIVGIGYGQHVLLPVFQADDRCEVVALAASTQERARSVADEHSVTYAYGDWRDMIANDEIDLIAVAVPPQQQPEIAIAAAEAGKHLLLEKPLATTLPAAQRMAMAVLSAGVAHSVDMEFPEIDAWQEAQRILAAGGIGALRHVELVWDVENYANRNRLVNWKTQQDGGGVLYNYMSHVFYNLEWFLGEPIAQLSALLSQAPTDTRTGDTVNIITAQMESGTAVSLTVSSHAFMGSGHRWVFYGDDGTLILENTTRDYVYGFTLRHATRADAVFREVPLPLEDASLDGRRLATGRVVDKLLRWIDGGDAAHPNIVDGVRVQRLIAHAQQSHQERRWVETLT